MPNSFQTCIMKTGEIKFLEKILKENNDVQVRDYMKKVISELKEKSKKYVSVKIQDTCIKLDVDRLGNITPVK